MEFFGGQGVIQKTSLLTVRIDFLNLLGLKFYLFTFFSLAIFFMITLVYLDSSK